MKKQVVFKKGQKVTISNGQNASDFNIGSIDIMGAYSVKNWAECVFEIEGTVKLINFESTKKVYGAYLLKYEGENIGYVYNDGITKFKKSKFKTVVLIYKEDE